MTAVNRKETQCIAYSSPSPTKAAFTLCRKRGVRPWNHFCRLGKSGHWEVGGRRRSCGSRIWSNDDNEQKETNLPWILPFPSIASSVNRHHVRPAVLKFRSITSNSLGLSPIVTLLHVATLLLHNITNCIPSLLSNRPYTVIVSRRLFCRDPMHPSLWQESRLSC